jgi:hypothetical protein
MKKKTMDFKFSVIVVGLSLIALMTIQSCSKSSSTSGPTAPTNPDGATSSNGVESAALISYFPFSGNSNDSIGKQTAAITGSVSYVPGVIGQAYQGAAGAYAKIPAAVAFNSLQSYSVSLWYNMPQAAKTVPVSGPPYITSGMFFLAEGFGSTLNPMLIMEGDIPSTTQYANDSVPIHAGFNNIGGVSGSWMNYTMSSFDTATTSWVHLVMTYNGATSTYVIYENGLANFNGAANQTSGPETSTTIYDGPLPLGSGTPPTQLMGNLNFTSAASTDTVFIGSWPDGLYGQSASASAFKGAIDEVRVYNIALSPADVASLYILGKAGF